MRHLARTPIVFALVLVVIAACGSSIDSVYSDSDTGDDITIDSGERFELRLESNPSTGYLWILDENSPMDLIKFESMTHEPFETTDDVVGAAGMDVFTFKAAKEGAGILRLEYIRSFDDPPIPERVVEYIVRVDGAEFTRDTSDPPSTATASAPGPLEIDGLIEGGEASDVTVAGFVIWDDTSARLCSVLLESFPPQCGAPDVIITNPGSIEPSLGDVTLQKEQAVRWTDQRVELRGNFDGERLTLQDGA
jgi:inhibitor of cysteine peptidase